MEKSENKNVLFKELIRRVPLLEVKIVVFSKILRFNLHFRYGKKLTFQILLDDEV